MDGTGRLYVNLEDTSQVAVVDTKELTVLAHYTLAPDCQRPTGLAIDSAQHRLFAVCGNAVMVVLDGHTGRILATLPIGGGADAAVFDPGTHRAFSANGDGTLTVVEATDADHYRVVQTLPTRVTARTLALDPATHRLYLAAAETDGFEPATGEHSHPRRHIKPGTFMILAVEESPWTSGRP